MEEQEQSGKAAYEAKKAQKQEERRAQADGPSMWQRMRPWVVTLVVLAVIVGGLWYLVWKELPKGEDYSREFSIVSRDHVSDDVDVDEYNSNPPTSGPHYGSPAQVRFYDVGESPADERIVHNLEHGDIWIAYHPRISDAQKEALREFTASKVLVSAREENDEDIALAAWGRLDTFNIDGEEVPTERIESFITRYINKGPEKVSTPQFSQ